MVEVAEGEELFQFGTVGGHSGFRVTPGKGEDGIDPCRADQMDVQLDLGQGMNEGTQAFAGHGKAP